MQMGSDGLFGCVEAGGAKSVCAVADSNGRWLSRTRVSTGHPDETVGAMVAVMRDGTAWQLTSLGVASFGPPRT
jgi:fructokinase